jgi:hypothetical protein
MSKLLECTGTLLLFAVPADGPFAASALLACSDCGALFTLGQTDERHRESAVLSVD